MVDNITHKKVAILATNYFEESELLSPLNFLKSHNIGVDVISPENGEIKGLKHVEHGESVKVDKNLSNVKSEDYDGLVVPGGAVNADKLRMDEGARNLIRTMLESSKPVAVICHGPWLLISAGIVKGKKLTSYFTIQDDIRNAGGIWVDTPVVVDGNLITSRMPDDLSKFNEAFMNALNFKITAKAF